MCTAILGGGFLLAVDICGRKYSVLRRARQEWNAKNEHEQSMPNTDSNRVQSYSSRSHGSKKVDRDDSEILRMGKWAWILHRASEMEQEERRGVGRK